MPMMDVVCRNCGAHFPPEVAALFFVRNRRRGGVSYTTHRPICIGCEQTKRDERKQRNRWRSKATSTLHAHARKYNLSAAAFAGRYGWDVARIAHDLEHAYDNTCTYCWKTFGEMGHGLADVTVDIVDPDEEPFYATNTKPCCRTCNTEKGRLSRRDWALKLNGWRIWRRQRDHNEAGFMPLQLGFFVEGEAKAHLEPSADSA